MLFWIALLLALRAFVLATVEARSQTALVLHCCHGFFLILLGILLFPQGECDLFTLLVSTSFLGFSLILRFLGFFQKSLAMHVVKATFFSLFYLSTLGSIALQKTFHLVEGTTVAHVTLTGKRAKKWVEWKNPETPYQAQWVDAYEVEISSLNNKGQKNRYFIYGDLVGIRAQTLHFSTLLNLIGFENGCRLDGIYNGYQTMERHQISPHLGYPIIDPSPFFEWMWKHLFYHDWKMAGMISGHLESEFLPLVDLQGNPIQATYSLKMTLHGLSHDRLGSSQLETIHEGNIGDDLSITKD